MTEPVHATSPEQAEPRTPLWLPALGAALFLSAGLLWASTPAPRPVVLDEPSSEAGAASASAAVPPPAAPATASASARAVTSAAPPSPSASAAASAAIQRMLKNPRLPPRQRPPPKDVH